MPGATTTGAPLVALGPGRALSLVRKTRLCEPLVSASRFLTDEGIEYLREYLNLPSEIVPATLKKSTRPLERNTGCVAGLPWCTLPLAVGWHFCFKVSA